MTYRRGLIALLISMLSGPCLAQNVDPGGVANVKVSDKNGLNFLTRLFDYDHIDISIGSGKHKLEFHRTNMISADDNNFSSYYYYDQSTDITNIVVDGVSARFFPDSLSNVDGNGNTLTVGGGFTTRDGTKYEFGATDDPYIRPTKISYPDGRQLKLTWKHYSSCSTEDPTVCETVSRISSIQNEAGYQLKFDYKSDADFNMNVDYPENGYIPPMLDIARVTALNNAVEYCDPSADHCTFTHQWAHADYVRTTTGYTATHADGQVDTYNVDGCCAYPNKIYELANSSGAYKRTVTYGTDPVGVVVTSIAIDGNTTNYNYVVTYPGSSVQWVITATDALGHMQQYVTSWTDPTSPRLNSYTDGNGHTIGYQYDSYGHVTRVTAPEQNYTLLDYDGRGNIVAQTSVAKPGSGLGNIASSSGFDASCSNSATCNQPNWTKDANGNQTDYTYDPSSGQTLTATRPAVGSVRPQARYSYTFLQSYFLNSSGSIVASGLPVSELTGTSACRTLTSCIGTSDETRGAINYGPQTPGTANNLLPISSTIAAGDNSLGATTQSSYDANGNRITATDPLGYVTAYHYNALQQIVGVVGPDPDGSGPLKNRAQRFTYNVDSDVVLAEKGTVLSQSDPDWANFVSLESVSTAYDNAGLKLRDTVQGGGNTYAVTQYSYDAANRLQCTAVRMNDGAFGSLPSSACSGSAAGSYGPDRITLNSYDNADQLLKVTTAYGVPGQQRDDETLTYTANSKLQTLTDANGNVTNYTWDGLDRAQSTHYPNPSGGGSSSTDFTQVLAYDADANPTSYRLRDGNAVAMSYDALNRLTGRTGATIAGRSYTYDNFGHTTAAILNGGPNITFGFDALGRQVSETWTIGTFTHGFDLAGRRTSLQWPDGFQVIYNRFATGEIGNIYENGTGATPLAMAYDDLGRLKIMAPANGHALTYSYDGADRLTAWSLAGLAGGTSTIYLYYNPASQIYARSTSDEQLDSNAAYNVNRSYAANGLNQYTKAGAPGLSYDALGNLTRLASTTYAYDGDNLLTGGSAGAGLAYDPLGRIAQVNDDGGTRFGYASGMLVAEYDMGGALRRRYVPGDAPDQPLVGYEGAGVGDRRFYAQDERGSVIENSGASGTISINQYDEWGIPGVRNTGRFGYTGQTWMPQLQAWNYKARVYNPILGRFLQIDPIGYAGGPNWYSYADGDPVTGSDSSGFTTTTSNPQVPITYLPPVVVTATPLPPLPSPSNDSLARLLAESLFGSHDAGPDGRQLDIMGQQLTDHASQRLRQPQKTQPAKPVPPIPCRPAAAGAGVVGAAAGFFAPDLKLASTVKAALKGELGEVGEAVVETGLEAGTVAELPSILLAGAGFAAGYYLYQHFGNDVPKAAGGCRP